MATIPCGRPLFRRGLRFSLETIAIILVCAIAHADNPAGATEVHAEMVVTLTVVATAAVEAHAAPQAVTPQAVTGGAGGPPAAADGPASASPDGGGAASTAPSSATASSGDAASTPSPASRTQRSCAVVTTRCTARNPMRVSLDEPGSADAIGGDVCSSTADSGAGSKGTRLCAMGAGPPAGGGLTVLIEY